MYWLLDLLFVSVCCWCQRVCLWADVVRLLIDAEAEAEGGGGEDSEELEAEGAERWERDVHRATDQMPDEATEADEAGDAAPSILVVIAGAPEDAGKGPRVHQVSIARTDTRSPVHWATRSWPRGSGTLRRPKSCSGRRRRHMPSGCECAPCRQVG